MNNKKLLFSTFLKNPKEVGSIIPSSKFLVNKMVNDVEFENAKYIAEYGSGTGIITEEILKRSRKDAKILCFETNKKLYNFLKNNINDARAIIINDSAENIKKYMKKYSIPKIDCILGVLSFSTLGSNKKHIIMKETKKALRDEGKFIFCRYLPHFEKCPQKYFSRIYMNFVPFNIPPSLVYVCGK
jgi:phospholipid N-methyltransferase